MLNDRFGIQTRGGCSCAGTYGHKLLHVMSADRMKYWIRYGQAICHVNRVGSGCLSTDKTDAELILLWMLLNWRHSIFRIGWKTIYMIQNPTIFFQSHWVKGQDRMEDWLLSPVGINPRPRLYSCHPLTHSCNPLNKPLYASRIAGYSTQISPGIMKCIFYPSFAFFLVCFPRPGKAGHQRRDYFCQ